MFLEVLRRVSPELTPSQQVLADYVTRYYRKVAFMTAARVAEAVAMNEATVIRFAQRLGYEGYPEMQAAIRNAVLAELQEPEPPAEPRTLAELFQRSLWRSSERIKSVASLIPQGTVEQAVTMLAAASEALVIGAGEGIPLGEHVARQLDALGLRSQMISTDAADLARALASVRPGTVLIGCGGTRGSTRLATAFDIAKQVGARTLALSHTPLAPEAHVAEVAFTPSTADESLIPALTALVALADALIETTASTLPESEIRRERILAAQEQLERHHERGQTGKAVGPSEA